MPSLPLRSTRAGRLTRIEEFLIASRAVKQVIHLVNGPLPDYFAGIRILLQQDGTIMTAPQISTPVLYRLTGEQAENVNARREAFRLFSNKIGYIRTGHQEHHGNPVQEGDQFAAMVVWRSDLFDHVNLVVFLDGNDPLWAPTVLDGEGPGTYSLVDRRVAVVTAPATVDAVAAATSEQVSDMVALGSMDEPPLAVLSAGDDKPAPAEDKPAKPGPETPIPADNDGPIIVGG